MLAKNVLLISLGVCALNAQTHTATYIAATCNLSDVNAVINGPTHTAIDTDVIQLPSGICSWTSQLLVKAGISIIGAGEGSTVIEDNFMNGTLFNIAMSSPSQIFRLSSITISPMALGTQPTLARIKGTCNSTTCSHIRWDHITSTGWINGTNFHGFLIYANDVFGVLDHLNVSFSSGGEFLNVGHGSYGGVGLYGDNSWAQPDSYGTDNALYIETSTFTGTVGSGMAITDTDSGGGGRFVGRFNQLNNANWQTHGTESTGRLRGGRHYEVYNNNLSIATGTWASFFGLRGGTALMFNNNESGLGQFSTGSGLSIMRDGTGFAPWGVCDGEGPWDQNDGIVYDTGTISFLNQHGTDLTVMDRSKAWVVNQWIGYSIVNLSKMDARGFHPGTTIQSNTDNSLASNVYGGWSGGRVPVFSVGDTYQILRAEACIDQVGHGGAGATLLSGYMPTLTGWVNEPLDPVYAWNNTNIGGKNPIFGWIAENSVVTKRLIPNVDYYQSVNPFTGTTGIGMGTLANLPTTCTPSVAYWATDQGSWNQSSSGGQGELFVCTEPNTWTLRYTPYTYPHPMTSEGDLK